MFVIEYIKPFISLSLLVPLHLLLGKLVLQKSPSLVINFFAGYSLLYLGFMASAFFSNKSLFISLVIIFFLYLRFFF